MKADDKHFRKDSTANSPNTMGYCLKCHAVPSIKLFLIRMCQIERCRERFNAQKKYKKC